MCLEFLVGEDTVLEIQVGFVWVEGNCLIYYLPKGHIPGEAFFVGHVDITHSRVRRYDRL